MPHFPLLQLERIQRNREMIPLQLITPSSNILHSGGNQNSHKYSAASLWAQDKHEPKISLRFNHHTRDSIQIEYSNDCIFHSLVRATSLRFQNSLPPPQHTFLSLLTLGIALHTHTHTHTHTLSLSRKRSRGWYTRARVARGQIYTANKAPAWFHQVSRRNGDPIDSLSLPACVRTCVYVERKSEKYWFILKSGRGVCVQFSTSDGFSGSREASIRGRFLGWAAFVFFWKGRVIVTLGGRF